MQVPNQEITLPLLAENQVKLFVKREDLIHPIVSGNKYRKLKYNLLEAKKTAHSTLFTFGGAYSNHIAAVAFAGKKSGFKTIGVIRGEELVEVWEENPTLRFAHEQGMQFHFVSREQYRQKNSPKFIEELQNQNGLFYLLPEGGTNALAVKGCEEILTPEDAEFDYVCCCVGTGGTLAGLINSSNSNQTVLGFPALKGDFLKEDIYKFVTRDNWNLITNYHFGGYAKMDRALIEFINDFRLKTGIQLDPIYTGKLFFGIMDRVEKGYFERNTRILAIHTGGLQGIQGMNIVLKQKNLPTLNV
ncbi:1-aminocyclopropane-1-carboxylate deaminase/D-cysteine desulfhydrase [Flagellimonas allohymeniacidonis]|uniref:1-aminocyclopropane-1-carboxylate deaminase/D-cysteine desulfhydrase n=1 Tax=Flagellimonas allohymeniacidonis TaxID=2517819 RepID=A0A4Q8QI99_9FLAO|nr:pyridoxal-phosphate dependent enzyme [Allomuricauda hymeniacidonis]TAI48119.1 1-aminocyclopropane-1-carboxylate deaminase/D-cysteine desulfhydrase [Allomuricauda hymeniacidonis]